MIVNIFIVYLFIVDQGEEQLLGSIGVLSFLLLGVLLGFINGSSITWFIHRGLNDVNEDKSP